MPVLVFFFFCLIDIENLLGKTKQRFILSLPANRHVPSTIHLLLYRRRRVRFCFAHAFPPPTRTKSTRSIRSGTKRTSSHDSRVTPRIFPAGISNSIALGYWSDIDLHIIYFTGLLPRNLRISIFFNVAMLVKINNTSLIFQPPAPLRNDKSLFNFIAYWKVMDIFQYCIMIGYVIIHNAYTTGWFVTFIPHSKIYHFWTRFNCNPVNRLIVTKKGDCI